jgi:hypothetical protein
MKTFETPNGKEIGLVRCPKTAHLKIQFNSGGELPEELTGLFTSENFAYKAIDAYLESVKNRKTPAAKTTKEE